MALWQTWLILVNNYNVNESAYIMQILYYAFQNLLCSRQNKYFQLRQDGMFCINIREKIDNGSFTKGLFQQ